MQSGHNNPKWKQMCSLLENLTRIYIHLSFPQTASYQTSNLPPGICLVCWIRHLPTRSRTVPRSRRTYRRPAMLSNNRNIQARCALKYCEVLIGTAGHASGILVLSQLSLCLAPSTASQRSVVVSLVQRGR